MSNFEKLAESLGLDPDTREQITEAWGNKLKEARAEIAAELREEFAQKFEHDKSALIKSMDRFITERVNAEIEEFAQDKREVAAERVRAKQTVQERIQVMDRFLTQKLAEEVKELRHDRQRSVKNLRVLENFVVEQLSKEVTELRRDRQALVEQRVKLVREGKKSLTEARTQLIKKSAKLIETKLNDMIQHEIVQYRQDIEQARKNDFGRRIFEAFVGEFYGSHLNESRDIKRFQEQLSKMQQQLAEARSEVTHKEQLLAESAKREKATRDLVGRERVMNELLNPLGKRERAIMSELLENVKTADLRDRFNKYLPSVLREDNDTTSHTHRRKTRLSESMVRTGDRAPSTQSDDSDDFDMNRLRHLAGLKSQ